MNELTQMIKPIMKSIIINNVGSIKFKTMTFKKTHSDHESIYSMDDS